tara:strand:+ start:193 stop:399 length:207 start_codon:yes stop_codon:yes gene_type:complete
MDELIEGDLVYYVGPVPDILGLSEGTIGVIINPHYGDDGDQIEVFWGNTLETWVGPPMWVSPVIPKYY